MRFRIIYRCMVSKIILRNIFFLFLLAIHKCFSATLILKLHCILMSTPACTSEDSYSLISNFKYKFSISRFSQIKQIALKCDSLLTCLSIRPDLTKLLGIDTNPAEPGAIGCPFESNCLPPKFRICLLLIV